MFWVAYIQKAYSFLVEIELNIVLYSRGLNIYLICKHRDYKIKGNKIILSLVKPSAIKHLSMVIPLLVPHYPFLL
jgi:hypothetical protein